MKVTKRQLRKLIQETMYKDFKDDNWDHNDPMPWYFGDKKTGATHAIDSPNMTKRSLHHALQLPPYDPIEGSNLDDETLLQLKSLRHKGPETSRQADELLDMVADPEDAPPNFGIKDKSYTDHAITYDKIHPDWHEGRNRWRHGKGDPHGRGIDYLTVGDSENPAVGNTMYEIDNMMYDIGLGWDDHRNHREVKLNKLLTHVEYMDHDKAVFRIKQYISSKDKETKKELKDIISKEPAIIHKLMDLAKLIEDEKKAAFASWHKV